MLDKTYIDQIQQQETSHWLMRDSYVSRVWEILQAARVDPVGLKLLDIGCSKGREVAALNSLGIKAEGLDAEPEFIVHAKVHNPLCRFTEGDLMELPAPFGPASFDIVTCFNTLFYVDTVAALPGIRALLRKGGLGIITLDSRIDDLDRGETIHTLDVDAALATLTESVVFFKNYRERMDSTPFHHKHYTFEIGFKAL